MPARHFILVFLLAAAASATALHLLDRQQTARPPGERFVLERKIASAIADGHHAGLPSGLNEAAVRWDIARLLPAAPEIAVFGSSHSVRISSTMLAARRSMNFSIAGGALSDHLITTEILVERQLRPRVWLIFVDAWLFDGDTDFGVWHQRSDLLARMESRLDHLAQPTLQPVFDEDFVGDSLPAKLTGYSLDPLVEATDQRLRESFLHVTIVDNPAGPMPVLRADGAFQPPMEIRPEDEPTASELAERQLAQNADRHRYGNFAWIDDRRWQLFTRWIQFCQSDGAEVWLVLPPYHPAIYQRILANPQNQLSRIELRSRELARQDGARLFGSYDPAKNGLGEGDFYDGDHLNDLGLKRLLAPLSILLARSASPLPATPP